MVPDPLQRVRRLALAAQVAAGGPPRIPQLIAAGYVTTAARIPVPPPRSRSAAASIGERRPSPLVPMPPGGKAPEPSAGPLVSAFAAATGRATPPAAWFIARGTRPARDASKTRAHGTAGVAAGPLPGTQEKDSRNAGR